MPACRSPSVLNRSGIVLIVKAAGSHAASSFQVERRGGARVWRRPDRVRGRDRPVLRVLVVVEKHAVALFLPPLARRERGRAPLDLARERDGGLAHLGESPSTLDAHVHVQTARARRLRPADEAEFVERRMNERCGLEHLRPRHARRGIEIDTQLVGMIEVVGADRMRMELRAREVGHPREGRGIARHDLVGGSSRRKTDRRDLNPVGPRRRRAFLKEHLRFDAVRPPDEHVRPAASAPQRALGDRQEILHEIALRDARLWKEHFRRVRDRDVVSVDLDDLLFFGGRHR